jgi:hypothetical protein
MMLVLSSSPLTAFPPDWPQEYLDALADASEEGNPAKIVRDLTPIVPYNGALVWENPGSADSRVLTVAFADDYYPTHYNPGDSFVVSASHMIWVTVAPEVREWVASHAFAADSLTARMEQLLGLPPNAGKTLFLEIWVPQDGLFRPSPDPEITDCEAELDFPSSPYFTITDEYKTWFNNLKAVSYTSDTAHPWTRLGYTYNWGNPYNHVGLSEYVVCGGVTVQIKAMTPTVEYCPLSPTVIDLGRDTATAGDHIVISACATMPSPSSTSDAGDAAAVQHPPPVGRSARDIYILITAPWGDVMSLTPDGAIVNGYRPYARNVSAPGERLCGTLLDYTVSASLPTGTWTAAVVLLPASAPFFQGHITDYDTAEVMIE